jgi:predicted alpha/beta superfamily hydrolase
MIVNGVIPYVEDIYPIDAKDRTFCGASYGGFIIVYSLFQSNGLTKDVFKNYVLASPTF